jgi:hypothetical protein
MWAGALVRADLKQLTPNLGWMGGGGLALLRCVRQINQDGVGGGGGLGRTGKKMKRSVGGVVRGFPDGGTGRNHWEGRRWADDKHT